MFQKKFSVSVAVVAVALFLFFSPGFVFAQWNDCPKGEVNDPFPGECGRYIDTDKDGICDHSQPSPQERQLASQTKSEAAINQPDYLAQENNSTENYSSQSVVESEEEHLLTGQEVKEKTVSEVAEIYGIDENVFAQNLSDEYGVKIKTSDSFQLLHDNYGVSPSRVKEIAENLANSSQAGPKNNQSNSNQNQLAGSGNPSSHSKKSTYPFFPILAVALFLYLFGWFWVKKGKLSRANFFRFWNFWLLISFLVSGLLGVVLVLRINYQVVVPFPFNVLYWHVEAGILMAIISVFHILWHWRYFAAFFKGRK